MVTLDTTAAVPTLDTIVGAVEVVMALHGPAELARQIGPQILDTAVQMTTDISKDFFMLTYSFGFPNSPSSLTTTTPFTLSGSLSPAFKILLNNFPVGLLGIV